MSQINEIRAPQIDNPQQQPAAAGADRQERNAPINDVVHNAEVQDNPPQPRAGRSVAAIIGRVILGIVTIGASEIGFAIAGRKRGNDAANLMAIQERNLEVPPAVAMTKEELAQAVQEGRELPEDLHQKITEQLEELASAFSNNIYQKNFRGLDDLPQSRHVRENIAARINAADNMDDDLFKSIVREEAMDAIKADAVRSEAEQRLCSAEKLEHFLPVFKKDIAAATNAAQLNAVFETHKADLQRCENFFAAFNFRCQQAQSSLADKLQQRIGVSPDVLRKSPCWDQLTAELDKTYRSLPLDATKADIEAALETTVENAAKSLGDAFEAIDKLQFTSRFGQSTSFSSGLKDGWKNNCLNSLDFAKNYSHYIDAAKKMSALAEAFHEQITESDPRPDVLASLLSSMVQIAINECRDITKNRNDIVLAGTEAMNVAKEMFPDLGNRLSSGSDLMKAIFAEFNKEINDPAMFEIALCLDRAAKPNQFLPATLERYIVRHDAPLHAQALKNAEQAVRDAVGKDLPQYLMEAQLPSGQTVAEALEEALRAKREPLSAADFGALVNRILCQLPDVSDTIAEQYREYFDEDFFEKHKKDIITAMTLRGAKPDSAEARAIIDLYRGMQDGPKLLDSAYDRIAQKTGMSRDGIQQAYRLTGIRNAFTNKNSALSMTARKTQESAPVIPTYAEIIDSYDKILTKDINKRVDALNAVNQLDNISEELKATFRNEVLSGENPVKPEVFAWAAQYAAPMDSAPLKEALKKENKSIEEITNALHRIGLQYYESSKGNKELASLEPTDKEHVGILAVRIMLDRDPELKALYMATEPSLKQDLAAFVEEIALAANAGFMNMDVRNQENLDAAYTEMARTRTAMSICYELNQLARQNQ